MLSHAEFRGIFVSDRPLEKDEEKKMKLLDRRMAHAGITGFEEGHLKYALRSANAQGDVDKAFELLLLLVDSIEGVLRSYTPSIKILGAVNREGITCYLDALLFAMFARLEAFEGILYKTFSDERRQKLAVILRLWVNMLRAGKLITTDITKHLQEAIAACGWKEAAKLRQQDTSEAFTVLTQKLELPLLTLKMDLYHAGKEDANGDHKFVNERLLEIPIPPEPTDGKPIMLEDCLEAYFNNRIEVKRYLERRLTIGSMASASVKSFDSSKAYATHIECVEVTSSGTSSPMRSSTPRLDENTPLSSFRELTDSPPSYARQSRSNSIIQERFIADSDDYTSAPGPHGRRGTVRKEVMMPAWQFFNLIRKSSATVHPSYLETESFKRGTPTIFLPTMLKWQHIFNPNDL